MSKFVVWNPRLTKRLSVLQNSGNNLKSESIFQPHHESALTIVCRESDKITDIQNSEGELPVKAAVGKRAP